MRTRNRWITIEQKQKIRVPGTPYIWDNINALRITVEKSIIYQFKRKNSPWFYEVVMPGYGSQYPKMDKWVAFKIIK